MHDALLLLPAWEALCCPASAVLTIYALTAVCAALDIVYCLAAVLFVRMWGEGQPTALEAMVALGRRLLLWVGSFLFIVGLEVQDNDYLLAGMISIVVLLVTWKGIQQTRRTTIEGGPPPDLSRLKNAKKQVIVITGANTGIGKETVEQLAGALHPESTILLLCRSVSKGEAAVAEIVREASCCKLQVVQCDLTSFASVRKAVAEIMTHAEAAANSNNNNNSKIDVLINNAGVMMKDLSYTEDGHETCLQANFLGHFLLTALLLPHTTTAVVNVTSSTYRLAVNNNDFDNYCSNLDEMQCKIKKGQPCTRTYSLFGQYAVTKWCNILHTVHLAESYSHVLTTAAAIHPGLVRTDVVRNMPWYLRIPNNVFAVVLQTLQKTPAQGAWCTVHVVAAAAMAPHDCDDATDNNSQSQKQSQTVNGHHQQKDYYWVNRRPQALIGGGGVDKGNTVQRQAATVWEWATQQVGLTPTELERLNENKASSTLPPSASSKHDKKLQ